MKIAHDIFRPIFFYLWPELPQLKSQHALCSINIAVGVVLFGNHNRQLLRAHYRVPEIFLECATKERKEMPGERRSEGRLFHNKMLIRVEIMCRNGE